MKGEEKKTGYRIRMMERMNSILDKMVERTVKTWVEAVFTVWGNPNYVGVYTVTPGKVGEKNLPDALRLAGRQLCHCIGRNRKEVLSIE